METVIFCAQKYFNWAEIPRCMSPGISDTPASLSDSCLLSNKLAEGGNSAPRCFKWCLKGLRMLPITVEGPFCWQDPLCLCQSSQSSFTSYALPELVKGYKQFTVPEQRVLILQLSPLYWSTSVLLNQSPPFLLSSLPPLKECNILRLPPIMDGFLSSQ